MNPIVSAAAGVIPLGRGSSMAQATSTGLRLGLGLGLRLGIFNSEARY